MKKKLLSILLTGTIVIGIAFNSDRRGEIQTIEETKKIEAPYILTKSDLSKLYTLKADINNDTCLYLSISDAEQLMKIAKAEGGDDLIAQAIIMRVILNRLADNMFPNTITEVLHQEKQFSAISDGHFEESVPSVNSHLALAMIESGWDESKGALFFEASWLNGSWQSKNKTFLFEYDGTKYYR